MARALGKSSGLFFFVLLITFIAASLVACSSDDSASSTTDSGADARVDGSPLIDGGQSDASTSTDGGLSIRIIGSTAPLTAHDERSFAADVSGSSDTSVVWSVDPLGADGGATTSSISAEGVFTAPSKPATYTVVAASHADPAVRATLSIPVVAAPIAVVTAPSLVAANATGLSASVVAQSGSSYAWTVTNGTVTAGDSTNAITFTAGASGSTTLTCVVTNAAGTTAIGSAVVSISVVSATSSLAITLSANPSSAVVTVNGPNGYTATVNASQTLTGLAAGSYSVTAPDAISSGQTYVGSVTGSPAAITAGAVGNISVTYAAHDETPTISAIADQTIYVGGDVTLPFTIGDAEDSANSLSVTSAVVGTGVSTVLGGSGASRTVQLVPGSSSGSADVTVTVTDSQSVQASRTFHVTTIAAVVTSTSDTGAGSLRDVASTVGAGATILFDSSLNGQTVTLASPVTLPSGTTLRGPGASLITIEMASFGWTLNDARIEGLTFDTASPGPVIGPTDGATLTIDNCAFHDVGAAAAAGAIGTATTLVLSNSTFVLDNNANALGAASATLRVTNVTVSGAGLALSIGRYADIAIASSTFDVSNAVVVNLDSGTTTTIRNSIIIGKMNSAGGPEPIRSLGYNCIVGAIFGPAYDSAPTDIFVDPKLDALGAYGGPTSTFRLQSTSPALDVVPAASCVDANGAALTTDQRGLSRPSGSACDIGAFERQPSDG